MNNMAFSIDSTSGHITASPGTFTTDHTGLYVGDYPLGTEGSYVFGHWYPYGFTSYTYSIPDKTGAAFKLAKKLIDNKIVDIGNDAEKFCKLVNAIVDSI